MPPFFYGPSTGVILSQFPHTVNEDSLALVHPCAFVLQASWCSGPISFLKSSAFCGIMSHVVQPGDEMVSTGEAGLELQAAAPGPR
jgi:hypothetical protein